ncbi:hypothetical protein GGR57DRAFT_499624 [Xylariaceae sp. FL1272]|nr:hypothetical protein GGR57DRAFT_499624 [Xylariaceae sp. FL1272]
MTTLADLINVPAAQPPDGEVSNLIDPESRSWKVRVTMGTSLGPAIILTLLRIYARIGLSRAMGIDDWFCVFALLAAITFNGLVLSFLDVPGGGAIGPHIWDVSLAAELRYMYPSIAESVLSRLANTLIKISLLTLYLRIFPIPRIRWMAYSGLVAVSSFFLAILIATLTVCVPRGTKTGLDAYITSAYCSETVGQIVTAGAIFSVISDVYILLIPIHLLPTLKLSRRRKIAVSSVFLLGFAALDLQYLPEGLNDFTWNVVDTYITKILEINIGILCACMPVVSALFVAPIKQFIEKIGSWLRTNETHEADRGYRDLPSVNSRSKTDSRDVKIPGATLTGIRTMIRNISGGSRSSSDEEDSNCPLPGND